MSALPSVLGHTATIASLWGALSRGALHHAILLEGPEGVGKRLVADRIAMAANCGGASGELALAGITQRPCGRCPTCRQIAAGVHPDVMVLEPDTSRAAAVIPVDAVRTVIRQAQFHRYSAAHRFVIVDPAEAMREAAANALLKTLEEPPVGTGFLLITHNARSLLPTIRSRCQRVRLGAVPEDQLCAWLEGRGMTQVEQIARLALGCPGRALELGTSALEIRTGVRDALLGILRVELGEMFAYTAKLTSGGRAAWTPRVDALLEVIEDLLRDAVIHASRAEVPLLNQDLPHEVERWAQALWPGGIERCTAAVQDCRDDLRVFVPGKTAVDALLCTLRRELGPS
ncbi:MAG TPA: DNA polymerase III subunit delta' [Deltaproteobacteria bacterium]|nr:DNA polymerase III subunit delta' [Deltaproteobacteria bacterium]